MGQWFKNMEYLEAYDDAALDTIEDDAEAINKQLDIIDRDRMARENGEKSVKEWERTDFKDLLHQYPRLRHWRTSKLQAVFLNHVETIDHVDYYKRLSMMETWERIDNGGPFNYDLADPAAIDKESEYAFERCRRVIPLIRAVIGAAPLTRFLSACDCKKTRRNNDSHSLHR